MLTRFISRFAPDWAAVVSGAETTIWIRIKYRKITKKLFTLRLLFVPLSGKNGPAASSLTSEEQELYIDKKIASVLSHTKHTLWLMAEFIERKHYVCIQQNLNATKSMQSILELLLICSLFAHVN